MKKVLIVSSIIAGVSALAIWGKIQYDKLLNFCYKINGFRINSITKDGVDFDLKLLFENKSNIQATIIDYNLDVSINDFALGTVNNTTNTIVKANSVSNLLINVNLKPQKKLEKLVNIVFLWVTNKKGDLILKVKGTATIEIYGIRVKNAQIDINNTFAELLAPSVEDTTNKCNI